VELSWYLPSIYQHRLSLKLLVLHQSYHTIEELEGFEMVMKLSFFAPPKLYSIVMKLSSFVMSSRDAKLSSWVAELALLVAAVELAAVVVAVTQVIAIVVAATKVIAVLVVATKVHPLVVVANEFVVVVVTVDISYAAPQAHIIVNVALHRVYSPGIIFIFSQRRNYLYHV
jgi:hypothetical protein